MPQDESLPPPGHDKPLPPEHSLPSYSEPTPETRAKLSREDEAELALNNTSFAPGTPLLLIALFLLTIAAVPIVQIAAESRGHAGGGHRLQMFDIYKTLPSASQVASVRSVSDVWNLLPRVEDIKAYEDALEEESVISQALLPRVQSVLTSPLRAGNEQAYLGRGQWLFYRPDVDYVTGPPFMSPSWVKFRKNAANVQPDPVKAIVEFRDQLAARGIGLIVVPAPVKPTVDGDRLSAAADGLEARQNPSFADFKARLEAQKVQVCDPAPLLMQRKRESGGAPVYLDTDTHWRPDSMQLVARALAALIGPSTSAEVPYKLQPKEISSLGDVATMLKLPRDQQIYQPQKVQIEQVVEGNGLWRPVRESDVLLLGDSFANIFSLEGMGWGEAAGLAEHLSYALQRPIDAILRNSDASFATREILSRELARGRDRLAGKKWVVWEFATRELSFGNWKSLPMDLGQPAPTRFVSPAPGTTMKVTGSVESVSLVPRPGSVPYKDHILAVHLSGLSGEQGAISGGEALAYLWSMRDNVWTPAARLRAGDSVTVLLRPWAEVESDYGKINRSDLEDPVLQLEEPAWGALEETANAP